MTELYIKKDNKLKAIEYYNQILKYYKENNIVGIVLEIEENIHRVNSTHEIELKNEIKLKDETELEDEIELKLLG